MLCVDKTGTVTSPQMQVREVVPLDPESCSETDITDILGAFYRVLDPDNDTAKAIADKFPRGPAGRTGEPCPSPPPPSGAP